HDASRLCAIRRAPPWLPTRGTVHDRQPVSQLLHPQRRYGFLRPLVSPFGIPGAHALRARSAGFRLPRSRRTYREKYLATNANSSDHESPCREPTLSLAVLSRSEIPFLDAGLLP